MAEVRISAMDDAGSFDAMCAALHEAHPDLRFGRFELTDGEAEIESDLGGVKLLWLYRGEGEVFLHHGYRSKEGDGNRLPEHYVPEFLDVSISAALSDLELALDTVRAEARPAIEAILERVCDEGYVGDYANDLWKLEHVPRPWSSDAAIQRLIEALWRHRASTGYSRKRGATYERIMEGDQLAVAGDESLQVRGKFACLTAEFGGQRMRQMPSVMRLRYLRDTAGGCNFDFDPFRRLPLTWQMELPGALGDGSNFINSHVVNIPKETSPTHFHPATAVGGGKPQHELYLVLDPAAYSLNTHGRTAQLLTWPDLRDLSRYTTHDLKPGDFLHIPPGTGHRGIDVFVNVLTVPGFKPHNEYYIDADVRDKGKGAPYNESLVGLKNYETLETLLA